MAQISYLERRGAVYYARLDIPTDLVSHYGTTCRKKSLKTKDLSEAKRAVRAVIEAWDAEFADVRSRRNLTSDDTADAVWQHYEAVLERDERNRQAIPTAAEIYAATDKALADARASGAADAGPIAMINAMAEVEIMANKATWEARRRNARLNRLRKDLTAGDTTLISDELGAYIDRNKLIIDPASPDRTDLARKLMRAEIEALERTIERDQGDYTGKPKDPIVRPVAGNSRIQAKPGETIMELFEVYAQQNPKRISQDTLNQARRDIGTLVEYLGSNAAVQRIDKKAVREWKALLLRYPVKATETKAFAGMKFAQIVRHNETVGKPAITPKTVNRYLSGLAAFCKWAVNHGYLDSNPTDGMFLAKEKGNSPVPFTVDQMNELFTSPLFTGCQSATEWRNIAKPGNVQIRDHRYWVPLIMLYSGARPAEIAQLAIADVRQEHGHWIMHITEEGEAAKSVKTAGSMRVVPVHDELIKLGFIKYYARMKQAGEKRLFPQAERNSRGQMIADFSREFGRYLSRIGMKEGRGLSLYSFRHGAVDALRRAGHLDEQFGYILGHTSATMTGRYGRLPEGMLQQRVDLINSIDYPGLNIDHLF